MKKSFMLFAILAMVGGAFNLQASTTEEASYIGKPDMKVTLTNILTSAKAYTLEVAEAMPAEDYNFKTTDSVKTFGEQLAHIAMSTMFINTKLIKGEELPQSDVTEEAIGASKEQTIQMLNMAFDSLIATIEGMSHEQMQETFVVFFHPDKPEMTKIEGFMFLRDHITHHRGQAIVYLRAKGHKAPAFRAF